MRRLTTMLILAAILGASPLTAWSAPPARPLAVTSAQFDQLCDLERQAEHAAVLDVQASFTSDRQKQLEDNLLADDITTAAYQFGWPGIYLAILICAAPL